MKVKRINFIFGLMGGTVAMVCLTMAQPVPAQNQEQDQNQQAELTTTMITDAGIADAVEDELQFDVAVNANRITVGVQDGVVTLEGAVRNLMARDRAERIASTVRGVQRVENNLEVQTGEEISDEQLAEDIEASLMEYPATEAMDVNVQVEDGEVTLRGEVQSMQERLLAGFVVRSINGVKDVDNQLGISYPQERPDAEIEEGVSETYVWDVELDHRWIDVNVRDGEVFLSGTVPSLAHKQRAIRQAWITGVNDVHGENLRVGNPQPSPPQEAMEQETITANMTREEIREAVVDAVSKDPRIEGSDISVEVTESGVATLRGTAITLEAKQKARELALSVNGVFRVKNRLRVLSNGDTTPQGNQQLEFRIEEAYDRNSFVDSGDVDVTVQDGTAILEGTVGTLFEKQEAEDIAARFAGVEEVVNNLTSVRPEPSLSRTGVDEGAVADFTDLFTMETAGPLRPDWQIAEDIRDELYWSPFVDSDDVNVEVQNGVATLTGIVDDMSEYRSAMENAAEGGATQIENKLGVREGPQALQPQKQAEQQEQQTEEQ